MVIGNKEDIINGFEMRAVSGQLEIDYMSDGRKVDAEDYENCTEAFTEVKSVLMEDTIHNLNVGQEEEVISLETIKDHVWYVVERMLF